MLTLALLSAALAGIGLLVAFIGLGQVIQSSESVSERLDAIEPLPDILETGAEKRSRAKKWNLLAKLLNRSVSKRESGSAVAAELARANLALTVTEWTSLRIGSIVLLSVLVLAITRQPLLVPLGIAAGFFLPVFYLRRRQNQRLVAFQEQLPDMLTLLVGSLRSGYGITIAMDTVAKNMPPPSSEEFGRVVREIGLGLTTTQALNNLVRRIRSDDLDLVVTAIAIQHEVGGNLANILDTITNTIRERIRLKGQLRALTSQPTMTRYILTALPIALGGIIFLLNRRYMMGLFTPGPTLIIPIGAAVSLVMGYIVMGKLSQIEV
jgi:tight adherence protein B